MVGLAVGVVEDGRDPLPQGLWRDPGRRQRGGDSVDRVPLGLAVQGRRRRHGRAARRRRAAVARRSGRAAMPPRCACPEGNEHRATVANLLSHTLGLFAHAEDPQARGGDGPAFSARQPGAGCTISARPAPATPIRTSPMTRRRRSSSGSPASPMARCCASVSSRRLGMTGASTSRAGLMAVAELGARPCRRQSADVRDQRGLLSRAGRRRGQRLDQGPRDLDAGADGAGARRAAARRARRGAAGAGQHARRDAPPRPLSRAHRRPRNTASAGGSSIMPATGSSAIMAGSRAIAR